MMPTEGIPLFYLELEIVQRLSEGVNGLCNQVSPFLSPVALSSAVVLQCHSVPPNHHCLVSLLLRLGLTFEIITAVHMKITIL